MYEKPALSLSVVIPTYNNADGLPLLCQDLDEVLSEHFPNSEIIVVDDGSKDSTWDRLRQLAACMPRLRCVRLTRNYGEEAAVVAGIREARGDIIATLDDDYYHDPKRLPLLISALDEDTDLVYARPPHSGYGILRRSVTHVAKLLLAKLFRVPYFRHISSYRVFRKEVAEPIKKGAGAHPVVDVQLLWATDRVKVVSLGEARAVKTSRYSFANLMTYFLDVVTTMSALPVRAMLVGSVVTFICAVLLVASLLGLVASGEHLDPSAFTWAFIAFGAAFNLAAVGVVGEYVGRVKSEAEGKPPYLIRERFQPEISTPEGAVQSRSTIA